MMHASDDQTYSKELALVSRQMLDLRDKVFEQWEHRVRQVLPQADALRSPALVDTLMAFYANIAQALTPEYPRVLKAAGTTLAAEHGGERARITAYDHESLIGEYQVFRWAIFDVLYDEGVQLDRNCVLTINTLIDAGIKEAVSAFALVHSALREQFAASLTHDLRSPLGTTATALELILTSGDLSRTKTLAVKALSNIRRMDEMIRELLDTMAYHTGETLTLEMSSFDMCEVVKEVQIDLPMNSGARVQLLGASVIGWWDRAAIKRAVENMVGNAMKYGRPGTPITVKVDEAYGRVMVSVHNEGDPIPAENQECVFQMYRRAEAAKLEGQRGWGIGLPYVRAVAESHGGSVGLESTVYLGTTFLLDVPIDCRPFMGAPTVA